ncbi:hypothetical protein ACFWOX_04705 [Streptomyces sp. NPDC058467]|uniref:hypothetical protein n=1 Tax=Streptomyces sp. NPDC058467 TaxID=3346513 RepID=UPI0036654F6F
MGAWRRRGRHEEDAEAEAGEVDPLDTPERRSARAAQRGNVVQAHQRAMLEARGFIA